MTDCTLAIAFTDGDTTQHQVCYSVLSNSGWVRSGLGDTNWSRRSNVTLSRLDLKRQVREELEVCLSESEVEVVHYVLSIGDDPSIVGGVQQLGDGTFAYYSNS